MLVGVGEAAQGSRCKLKVNMYRSLQMMPRYNSLVLTSYGITQCYLPCGRGGFHLYRSQIRLDLYSATQKGCRAEFT